MEEPSTVAAKELEAPEPTADTEVDHPGWPLPHSFPNIVTFEEVLKAPDRGGGTEGGDREEPPPEEGDQ